MAVPTRTRLIEVAERLFAERGIAAVSLREIGATAGQRNNSAATYHFGSKQKLIDAVFEYRMARINQRRLAMLAALDHVGRGEDIRAVAEALVYPVAETITERSHYARFIAQAFSDPVRSGLMSLQLDVMESARHVWVRFDRCLRGVPRPIRAQRLVAAGAFFVTTLAQHERDLHQGTTEVPPTAVLVSNLVDMMVGLLTAPVSEATRRKLRATGTPVPSKGARRQRRTEVIGLHPESP